MGMCRANKHLRSGGTPGDALTPCLHKHTHHRAPMLDQDKANTTDLIEARAAMVRKNNPWRQVSHIDRTIGFDGGVRG